MSVLYTNNATTTLSASITNSTTSLSVASGKGSLFPAITGSDFFFVTISNSAGTNEIVKVTARSVDTLTIVRAQDGTSAAAWSAGDKVELRITKAMLDQFKNDITANLSAHTSNTSNPHSVTATQVGLGNVTNESKATMFTSPTFTGTVSGITKSMVGLGNVTNESKATMFTSPTFTGTVSGVTASMVGLGNVENKSSATIRSEIISSNVTTALGYTPLSTTGTAADSDKLDGQHGSYYQPASTAITTSNIGSQSVSYASSAGNADTLDGYHASSFLRESQRSWSSSGYMYFSNGLIIQWGVFTQNNVTDVGIAFPVTFPNWVGFVTVAMNSRTGGEDKFLNGIIAYGVTLNGFTSHNRVDSNGNTFRWVAIGY